MKSVGGRNINFRQTAREFRAAATARVYSKVQRFLPYSRDHFQKVWTFAAKPVKIASKFLSKKDAKGS